MDIKEILSAQLTEKQKEAVIDNHEEMLLKADMM